MGKETIGADFAHCAAGDEDNAGIPVFAEADDTPVPPALEENEEGEKRAIPGGEGEAPGVRLDQERQEKEAMQRHQAREGLRIEFPPTARR